MGNYDFKLDLDTRNTMSLINNWIEKESVVLEFGPANGRLTRYLKDKKSCLVTIVEIDAEAGSEASQFAEKSYVGEEEGNIENYYWTKTTKKYDYIILADVLEHLSDPRKVLQNCFSVLKDNGKILVSIPNMAHNSILISLFNDEFEYDKTGLLDHSHIHFFTNTSFKKMINNTGLYIYKTEPIYSRVGNNEIHNTYEDVPIEVSTAIRKRKPGSIYQYVYMLGKLADKENTKVTYEDIDQYEEQETTCFWTTSLSDEISVKNSFSQKYSGAEKNTVEFNMSFVSMGKTIRWDPLEHNCVIILNDCFYETQDGRCIKLKYVRSNSVVKLGQFFCFETDDPMIFFEIEKSNEDIKRIVFSFSILKQSFVMSENDKLALKEIIQYTFTDEQKEKEKIQLETINQLYIDVAHRDKDITELKKFIDARNLEFEKQKIEIDHLSIQNEQKRQIVDSQLIKIEQQENVLEEHLREIEKKSQEIEKQSQEIEKQIQEIERQAQTIEAYKHPIKHMLKKIKENRRE